MRRCGSESLLTRLGQVMVLGATILWLGSSGTATAFPALLVAKGSALPKVTEPRVVVVRDGNRTVLTLTAVLTPGGKDLAWVLPVPSVVEAKHFNVGDTGLIETLDRFTAPRLIVARDENPCDGPPPPGGASRSVAPHPVNGPGGASPQDDDQRVGYTYVVGTETQQAFDAGDYDVSVLNASDSGKIATWLARQGYKLPAAARGALQAAVKAKSRFAVARIKLPAGSGGALKPLQVAYEAPAATAATLPLAFGWTTLAPRDALRLYVLSANGRMDVDGVPMMRFPAGAVLPLAVKDDLGKVYDAIVAHAAHGQRPAALLEYAGDVGFCEPCVDEPPSVAVLRKLGVFWLKGITATKKDPRRGGKPAAANATGAVYLTRWRFAYDGTAPKGALRLTTTGDRNEFHPRLGANEPHPGGESTCDGATEYARRVSDRQKAALAKLAELTGWDPARLEKTLGAPAAGTPSRSWVDDVWQR